MELKKGERVLVATVLIMPWEGGYNIYKRGSVKSAFKTITKEFGGDFILTNKRLIIESGLGKLDLMDAKTEVAVESIGYYATRESNLRKLFPMNPNKALRIGFTELNEKKEVCIYMSEEKIREWIKQLKELGIKEEIA